MKVFINKIFRSFNSRILLAAFILIGVAAASLNYYFYQYNTKSSRDNLLDNGHLLAQLMAQNSALSIFSENVEDLKNQVVTIFTEQNCRRVIFFDDQGLPLLDQSRTKQTTPNKVSELNPRKIFRKLSTFKSPLYYIALPDQMAVAFMESIVVKAKYSDDDIFINHEVLPIPTHGSNLVTQTLGYVVLIMDTSHLYEQAQILLRRSIVVTFSLAFVSCLFVLVVVTYLTRPLAQLTKEIALHPVLPNMHDDATLNKPEGTSFFGDFGDMISVIRQAYVTINDLNNNLETKVKIRTTDLIKSNQELETQKISLEENNRRLARTLDELQTTQEQLVRSEKMAALGQLISGLAHEINNSINFISGSLPLLKRNLGTQQKAFSELRSTGTTDESFAQSSLKTETLLANIEEGIKRIVGVVKDLRIFSHSGRGDMVITDIISGLKASVAIIRHEKNKEIVIQEDYAEDFPKIRARSGQLSQVYINILLNAVQAIKKQGMITVRAWYDPQYVHIAIGDNGEGIDPHIMSQIFDPFFTTKEVGKGTGMGLGISYSIIKKHHGEIKVDSQPGVGTTFEIVLPRP